MNKEMEVLDFTLPPWTRIMWVTEEARTYWEPKIARVQDAIKKSLIYSVTRGHRTLAEVTIPDYSLGEYSDFVSSHGLTMMIRKSSSNGFKILAFKPESLPGISRALIYSNRTDDYSPIREKLGAPVCCLIENNVWTSSTANNKVRKNRVVELEGNPYTNVILEPIGIVPVPYTPCSTECKETEKVAKALRECMRELGMKEEESDLDNILSWSMEWSILHGIAEIKTPIFKISANAIATAHKHTIQSEGSVFPQYGARGTSFPYFISRKFYISESKSYKSSFGAIKLEDRISQKKEQE